MIEDIGLRRALPRMQVIVPADYNQAYRATVESYEMEGPIYLRFGRPATPAVYEGIPEPLGGVVDVLREGKDISIFVCGHMTWRGLEAADVLAKEDGLQAQQRQVAIRHPLDQH